MLHGVEHGKFPQGSAGTPELIGVNDLWDIVFTWEPGQERLCGVGVAVALRQDIEHETVLVDRSPQPMSNAVDRRTDLVQIPAGTPAGFPLAQIIREQRAELDAPFAQRLVPDQGAALVEQFLNIPVTQGEAVAQPDGVLNDGHRESVAVRGRVGHGRSAYPRPVKATQPIELRVRSRPAPRTDLQRPDQHAVQRHGFPMQPPEQGLDPDLPARRHAEALHLRQQAAGEVPGRAAARRRWPRPAPTAPWRAAWARSARR